MPQKSIKKRIRVRTGKANETFLYLTLDRLEQSGWTTDVTKDGDLTRVKICTPDSGRMIDFRISNQIDLTTSTIDLIPTAVQVMIFDSGVV